MKISFFLFIVLFAFPCKTFSNNDNWGKGKFSITELWFEKFIVPIPPDSAVLLNQLKMQIDCDKTTPFVFYQIRLNFSPDKGLYADVEILQDPTVNIKYIYCGNKKEKHGIFYEVDKIKGDIIPSGDFTQIKAFADQKIRYKVILNVIQKVNSFKGGFFKIERVISGIFEIDKIENKVTLIERLD